MSSPASAQSTESADGASVPESPPQTARDMEHKQFESMYSEFLDPQFDPMQYARRVVARENALHSAAEGDAEEAKAQPETADRRQNPSVSQTDEVAQIMSTLASRADSLDSLMKHKILSSHEELLRQVIGVKAVDSTLGQIEEQVREVKSYMHGLRAKIRVPYEQALMYTNQSTNLQTAIKYVRSTSKFIQLVRRLKMQIPDSALEQVSPSPSVGSDEASAGKETPDGQQARGGPKPDFPLAALTLLDIEKLVGGGDLSGIGIVDDALLKVVARRRELTIKEAERILDAGMKRQNQSDIASGLQIMFNLGTLAATVASKVRQYTIDWSIYVTGKLDPKNIHAYVREHNAKATNIDGSDMIGITTVVWSTLESMVDELLGRGLELRTLERVLARKRDSLPRFDVSVGALDGRGDSSSTAPAAGTSFLDLVVGQLGDRALAFWWGTAVAALSNEIEEACKNSNVIRQTLTNSYPRLVQLFVPKLEHILSPRLGGITTVGGATVMASSAFWQTGGMMTPRTPAHHHSASVVTQSTSYVSYDDPGPLILWNKLLGRFEAEYVSKAASRIDDAVKRCYPPPPPPGLLNAQESWKRGTKGKQSSGQANGSQRGGGPTELELMAAVSVVPNRKLVAGVVRSISTELEMAKSDAKLRGAVAEAAAAAISSFVDITANKLASITVNPSVLDPLTSPPHPLTKSYVGLVNSVESLRAGLVELCEEEFGIAGALSPRSARLRSIGPRSPHPPSAQSSRAGSVAGGSFAASGGAAATANSVLLADAGSRAVAVSAILDTCLRELGTFVSTQTSLLLNAADSGMVQSIINAELEDSPAQQPASAAEASMDSEGGGRLAVFGTASQWLQSQILECLEADCQRQVLAMVDRYLRLYVRSVCLTFPLTEDAKLRLTGEVTQFEFACSQLIAASSKGTKPKLSDIGDSYQALRLMRPLLFMDIRELSDAISKHSSLDGWKHLSAADLLDHTVCRIATEYDDSGANLGGHLPHSLLGWTKEEWVELVSAAEDGGRAARYNPPAIRADAPPAIQLQMNGSRDLRLVCGAVFLEVLDSIAAHIPEPSAELERLVQSAKDMIPRG
ncbi:hypothetical protein GQ54DRAFT_199427 [Martensiomyces pterosporus]|nr:hypothetical protein GQ54DRAFT_199427 [Martensiomyces pterosporus]